MHIDVRTESKKQNDMADGSDSVMEKLRYKVSVRSDKLYIENERT